MLDSLDISQLYENVLLNDMKLYNIQAEDIKFGIKCMNHVYETTGLNSERSKIADYSDPAHRCAYLHKYAQLHTAMVRDMLKEAMREDFNFFQKLIESGEPFKMCSLGGGPGTDIIGSLATLQAAFGDFDTSVTVIDYIQEWSSSFCSILKEIGNGEYGAFGNNLSYYLRWKYIRANLLRTFKSEVREALSSANLVTMIKFTSAAACIDTYSMIRNIFTTMKEGAALLFIDNAGGGFHNLIVDAAAEFGFVSKFGPLRREIYMNNLFKRKRFGHYSCCQTTVTVHLLQKPFKTSPYDNLSFAYTSSHEPRHRQVVIDSNTKPSLGSPLTPYLFRPDENCNELVCTKPSLLISITPTSPAISDTIQTPFCHDHRPDENDNCLDCASDHEMEEITYPSPRSVIITSPDTREIINAPYRVAQRRSVIHTPKNRRRGKKARRGCLPLRVDRFRNRLSDRFNQIKAHARSYFKKRKKKSHPIFKL